MQQMLRPTRLTRKLRWLHLSVIGSDIKTLLSLNRSVNPPIMICTFCLNVCLLNTGGTAPNTMTAPCYVDACVRTHLSAALIAVSLRMRADRAP